MPLFEPATCDRAHPMTEVVRTYLELTDPAEIRPAPALRVDGHVAIEREHPPDGATSRWFYEQVGGPYQWTDNLGRTDAEWQGWAEQVETWVATVDAERAGYYELRPGAGSAEQHDAFLALTPRGAELEFHVNMLRHGRRTCHAQRPACAACALRRMCPSRRV